MSDPRTQRDMARGLEQTQVIERPMIYLPWTQRALNPFPLASSGTVWGDSSQPWSVNLRVWAVSVLVSTTNSATQFWTLTLTDSSAVTLATLTTSAIAANTWARLTTTTITQPSSTNPQYQIILNATLSPGSIFVIPALALFRTGN